MDAFRKATIGEVRIQRTCRSLARPGSADCGRVLLAFRLDVNEWKGERRVQFVVQGVQA